MASFITLYAAMQGTDFERVVTDSVEALLFEMGSEIKQLDWANMALKTELKQAESRQAA